MLAGGGVHIQEPICQQIEEFIPQNKNVLFLVDGGINILTTNFTSTPFFSDKHHMDLG